MGKYDKFKGVGDSLKGAGEALKGAGETLKGPGSLSRSLDAVRTVAEAAAEEAKLVNRHGDVSKIRVAAAAARPHKTGARLVAGALKGVEELSSARGAQSATESQGRAGAASEERLELADPHAVIGARYRSNLALPASVDNWRAAVRAAYPHHLEAVPTVWGVPSLPRGYEPYFGTASRVPDTDPDVVLVAENEDPQDPQLVVLAGWDHLVSYGARPPVVELWCVTPERMDGLARQRLESFWTDDSLSRLGMVERGLWGAVTP